MDQLAAAKDLKRGDKRNPVHMQIQNIIIDHILSGELKDGERLPTERDFAEELGIAVRKVTGKMFG
jgi:DNA-binding transcriptional regulator YhcF (GntR family)